MATAPDPRSLPPDSPELAAEVPNPPKKFNVGLGVRAYYLPDDNRWGPAPEISMFAVIRGFKGGAYFAVLPGGMLGIEVGTRLSGGPTLGKGFSLDFGAEVGAVFFPTRKTFAFDAALNVLAASYRAGPILILVRFFSPAVFIDITSSQLTPRLALQGGFTIAF
jgi:hypothetical protein